MTRDAKSLSQPTYSVHLKFHRILPYHCTCPWKKAVKRVGRLWFVRECESEFSTDRVHQLFSVFPTCTLPLATAHESWRAYVPST